MEVSLQCDFAAWVSHLLAHGEAWPSDTGAEVGLTAGVELIAADAEAEQGAIRQFDASGDGVGPEHDGRQGRLNRGDGTSARCLRLWLTFA